MGDTSRCHTKKVPNTYLGSGLDKATRAQVVLSASGARAKPLSVLTLAELMARYPRVAAAAQRWTRFSDWHGKPARVYRPPGSGRNSALLTGAFCFV